MTVKELIEELKKYNDDYLVFIWYDENYSEWVERVWEVKRNKRETRKIIMITNN